MYTGWRKLDEIRPAERQGIRHQPAENPSRSAPQVDATAGWRSAVAELGHRRLTYDPHIAISSLEIQCHGMPACLLLPDDTPKGLINHATVAEFGLLLKPHLATGALIELMACLAASNRSKQTARTCLPRSTLSAIGKASSGISCPAARSGFWALSSNGHSRR